MKNIFYNPTIGKLTLDGVVRQVADFVNSQPDFFYRLIIGSDSCQKRGENGKYLNLVTAIVIHRQGKGGRYFWQRRIVPKIYTLRDRIYSETLTSLEIAQEILPKINKVLNGERNYELEIHIDVGRSGETRDMIKEVVGMVVGNGFTAKTKPDSYGASKVADKHT